MPTLAKLTPPEGASGRGAGVLKWRNSSNGPCGLGPPGHCILTGPRIYYASSPSVIVSRIDGDDGRRIQRCDTHTPADSDWLFWGNFHETP